ncbi:lactate utilization protein [Clostridium baratii]|uniref:lactate utilization protein n=1 Tax=Clostridium baratii TaxID=1561 RepID=UPI002A75E162|nr:lactate utilization protein [Clostridium baratii]MDY3206526.1 lactate utilization protein [Clostridium baratii]
MNDYEIWSNELKIERTIKALEENNMNGYYARTREDLIDKIKELVDEGAMVTCGGSETLFKTGVIDYLRSGRYDFLDRYKEGITREEVTEIFRQAFLADAYFVSSNAITEDGEIYNVDGNGNRVAAMLFGPDKVIIICGVNKIVKDLDAAIKRNRELAAPMNTKRLNKKTPCAKVGYCMDCRSPERICNEYTLIKRQRDKDRIHVIFLNENLGF